MVRLIDADALKSVFTEKSTEAVCGAELCKAIISRIDDAPTVDAEPVRHGKWVQRFIKIGGQVFKHGMQCSVCAEPALDNEGDDYLTNYCPNCGAKMDAERKERKWTN